VRSPSRQSHDTEPPCTVVGAEFDESDEVERSKKVTLTLQIETTTVVKE